MLEIKSLGTAGPRAGRLGQADLAGWPHRPGQVGVLAELAQVPMPVLGALCVGLGSPAGPDGTSIWQLSRVSAKDLEATRLAELGSKGWRSGGRNSESALVL